MMEEVKYGAQSESPTNQLRYQESVSPGTSYAARLTGHSEFVRNWVELRLMGQQPDRRSYHSSFIFDKKLFVFGGLDIREGSINSLYELNLQLLGEISPEELMSPGGDPLTSNYRWRYVQTSGNAAHIPSNIAYHTSIVWKDNMYLFGGNVPKANGVQADNDEDLLADKLFYLNLRTMSWSMIRTRGAQVLLRDEHTAVVDHDTTQMIVFGGFQQGNRTNQTAVYNFTTNQWENIEIPPGNPIPCSRSGHTASIFNGNMYVFGGKDDSSEKLNDLWVYNIADKKWIEVEAEGEAPYERSGHSSDIYDDYLVIFGGIWDVTKELNDLHLYSFSRNQWITLQSSANSPQLGRSPQRGGATSSQHPNFPGPANVRDSPTASPMRNELDSPMKHQRSITKKSGTFKGMNSTAKKRQTAAQGGVRPMNTLALLQKTQSLKYEGTIRLNSPTSDQMQRSYLIKNHDASNFDQYYQQMRKRKTMGGTMRFTEGSPMLRRPADAQIFHVKGKRPAARDGHTGIVFQDHLIIFGGDRHHMPFNDSYVFNLSNEIRQLANNNQVM